MPVTVVAADRPEVPSCFMPDRFRHDVTYFATPAGVQDAPAHLPEGEYWIRSEESRRILDDGVITIVSPLDSSSRTELEITEDQEALAPVAGDARHPACEVVTLLESRDGEPEALRAVSALSPRPRFGGEG